MASEVADPGLSPTRGRLLVGGGVLIFGWLCPLFVPLVLGSDLSSEWKTTLSGLLLLGIPELFTLAAVAILGKSGFQYLKGILYGWFRRLAPPDTVSLARYRIGLVMFLLPLLFAELSIYAPNLFPGFAAHPMAFAVTGDAMFFASLLVLGGDFWDKIRALFVHGARARFPQTAG
jgi:hypothetical protein